MYTQNTLTGDITCNNIRTLYDLGKAYYTATKGVEEQAFFDSFRQHDSNGLPIDNSPIDYAALAQGALDCAPSLMGEFVDKGHTYKSGGETVYNGFTWFKSGFPEDFWTAIESAFPVSA